MAHKRKKTEDLILIHITINDGNEYEGLCSCDKSFCYPSIGFEGWGEYYYGVNSQGPQTLSKRLSKLPITYSAKLEHTCMNYKMYLKQ